MRIWRGTEEHNANTKAQSLGGFCFQQENFSCQRFNLADQTHCFTSSPRRSHDIVQQLHLHMLNFSKCMSPNNECKKSNHPPTRRGPARPSNEFKLKIEVFAVIRRELPPIKASLRMVLTPGRCCLYAYTAQLVILNSASTRLRCVPRRKGLVGGNHQDNAHIRQNGVCHGDKDPCTTLDHTLMEIDTISYIVVPGFHSFMKWDLLFQPDHHDLGLHANQASLLSMNHKKDPQTTLCKTEQQACMQPYRCDRFAIFASFLGFMHRVTASYCDVIWVSQISTQYLVDYQFRLAV